MATKSCHGVSDQNTQTCPCKWVCISLTALLEGSSLSQTFFKGSFQTVAYSLESQIFLSGDEGWVGGVQEGRGNPCFPGPSLP